MKKISLFIIASVILIASAFTANKIVSWKVKDNYRVKCVEVGGFFRGLKAFISFDEDKPETSKITATIEAKTIDVGDGTQKAIMLLEAGKYPLIMFESTSVAKKGEGKYEATANLTIKGITKQIKFPFYFSTKKGSENYPVVDKEVFAGLFSFNPKDFNIDYEKEKLTMELIIPVTK